MRFAEAAFVGLVVPLATTVIAVHVPLREYSGSTFFDRWDYWGNVDNTTWGNVTYLDRATANERRLTYVDDAGHAIIKVDNTTNIAPATLVNRPSVRITTQDAYGVGTLWIMDAVHIPYGCSVWPSFWSLGTGKEWPHAGEIDIVEGINLSNSNQMALHTDGGCVQSANPRQSGTTLERDCQLDRGCIVRESKQNSFGEGFASAGGGVYAVQMDVEGVYIWFWSRSEIPDIIKDATPTTKIDIALFGIPSASYPASGCNITEFFGPQKLVLLTTLCGSWAGVPSIYASTCPGSCIADNIMGPGSNYDTAYWDINYIKTYIAEDLAPLSSSTSSTSSSPPTTQGSSGSSTPTPTPAVNQGVNNDNGAAARGGQYWPTLVAMAVAIVFM